MRTVAVVSMLFFGWLLVLGACIEIIRTVMAGHRLGFFYRSLAARASAELPPIFLLLQSGHSATEFQCPLLEVKRT